MTGSGGHRAAGGKRLGAVESSNLTTPDLRALVQASKSSKCPSTSV